MTKTQKVVVLPQMIEGEAAAIGSRSINSPEDCTDQEWERLEAMRARLVKAMQDDGAFSRATAICLARGEPCKQ